jgi:hypothetical protein
MTLARDRNQRGAAMMVVMIVITALLGVASISIYLAVIETRSTEYVATARRSLYCAEAGLAASRTEVSDHYGDWFFVLDGDPGTDPGSWYPIRGWLDDAPHVDGVDPYDYEVTLKDNDDELPPTPNDPTHDNDAQVFVVARCLKYPEVPRAVTELLTLQGAGEGYRDQSGQGGMATGNNN